MENPDPMDLTSLPIHPKPITWSSNGEVAPHDEIPGNYVEVPIEIYILWSVKRWCNEDFHQLEIPRWFFQRYYKHWQCFINDDIPDALIIARDYLPPGNDFPEILTKGVKCKLLFEKSLLCAKGFDGEGLSFAVLLEMAKGRSEFRYLNMRKRQERSTGNTTSAPPRWGGCTTMTTANAVGESLNCATRSSAEQGEAASHALVDLADIDYDQQEDMSYSDDSGGIEVEDPGMEFLKDIDHGEGWDISYQ